MWWLREWAAEWDKLGFQGQFSTFQFYDLHKACGSLSSISWTKRDSHFSHFMVANIKYGSEGTAESVSCLFKSPQWLPIAFVGKDESFQCGL